MRYSNIQLASEQVNFKQAVMRGLGQNQGLFFPEHIPEVDDLRKLLKLDFISRSTEILLPYLADVINAETLGTMLEQAFNFDLPLVKVNDKDNIHALELFHGPSLAFKDFGARFLAQCFEQFSTQQPQTILTATSGDTGAAVAHAFYGMQNIRAVILYPKGRITALQEKLFCTLGGNIHTIAIDADFDACQQLVKQAFSDSDIRHPLNLNSANSINVARLLAQVCYYFEAAAQLGFEAAQNATYSVPSGNFGNATAGMIARCMGLPMRRLIAATNENDTVPRFLAAGHWSPRSTVATITNAMDVSLPNNFIRIQRLAESRPELFTQQLSSYRVSEEETLTAICELDQAGYLADPHSALAYSALMRNSEDTDNASAASVFLCTAHPAKFVETLNSAVGREIQLPAELAAVANKSILSVDLDSNYENLKDYLQTNFYR